jgi:hypothetical protein
VMGHERFWGILFCNAEVGNSGQTNTRHNPVNNWHSNAAKALCSQSFADTSHNSASLASPSRDGHM